MDLSFFVKMHDEWLHGCSVPLHSQGGVVVVPEHLLTLLACTPAATSTRTVASRRNHVLGRIGPTPKGSAVILAWRTSLRPSPSLSRACSGACVAGVLLRTANSYAPRFRVLLSTANQAQRLCPVRLHPRCARACPA